MLRQIFVVAGIIAAVSGSAHAQSLRAQVAFSIDDVTVRTGTTEPVTATGTVGNRAAEATARYGELHVVSSVVNGGQASGNVSWTDSFTITGPTPGTVAPFLVTFRVTGELTVPDTREGANPAVIGDQYSQFAAWLFGLPPSGVPCVALQFRQGAEHDCSYSVTEMKRRTYNLLRGEFGYTDSILNDLERTFTVQLEVGRTYSVRQELMAQSIISAMFSSTAAANMTAVLYIDPISPEYSYTTGSGRNYRSPVTNSAPTATAGNNQTVRLGTTVHLDGTGSFDDNTPTNELQYSWSFVSVPTGSQATLTDGGTATPSFLPDAHGSYVVQLVVTDQDGLSSAPSLVSVAENSPPTANAGADRIVLVGTVVQLAGSGADADDDPVTFAWTLSNAPAGSTSAISNSLLPNAAFVPDRAGVYVAQLIASDVLGSGEPDTVQITAITGTQNAENMIQSASDLVAGLGAGEVTNKGNQNALLQHLSQAVSALQASDLIDAAHKLELAISRVDGCAARGSADGNGPSRDWVTTCGAQNLIYRLLLDALNAFAP